MSQDDKDNNVYDVKGSTPDEMPTPDPSESPKPVYGETENAVYEYKGITQVRQPIISARPTILKAVRMSSIPNRAMLSILQKI